MTIQTIADENAHAAEIGRLIRIMDNNPTPNDLVQRFRREVPAEPAIEMATDATESAATEMATDATESAN